MNSNWLRRSAAAAARGCLFAGAAALLLVGWGGVARAGEDVPELSPGAIGGALTLLSGGLLLLRERLRS
jgi:hypothetical protein